MLRFLLCKSSCVAPLIYADYPMRIIANSRSLIFNFILLKFLFVFFLFYFLYFKFDLPHPHHNQLTTNSF